MKKKLFTKSMFVLTAIVASTVLIQQSVYATESTAEVKKQSMEIIDLFAKGDRGEKDGEVKRVDTRETAIETYPVENGGLSDKALKSQGLVMSELSKNTTKRDDILKTDNLSDTKGNTDTGSPLSKKAETYKISGNREAKSDNQTEKLQSVTDKKAVIDKGVLTNTTTKQDDKIVNSNHQLSVTPVTENTAPVNGKDNKLSNASETLPVSKAGFRVTPYLVSVNATAIRINWFTELDEVGFLAIHPVDSKQELQVKVSTPEYLSILEYTDKEISENITFNNGNGEKQTLPKGEWLKSNANYRHSILLENLKPNTTYTYSVRQGKQVYHNSFKTAPSEAWDKIRIIAFADTETEPKGTIENREWGMHPVRPYAPGSQERPDLESLWAKKYGHDKRNGVDTIRYPMNQKQALNENLTWIEKANPNLLMIAGDLTQGSGYQPAWDEFWRHFSGEHTAIAGKVPLITALGNWETYAALNSGYGTDEDRSPVVISRHKYYAYMNRQGDSKNPQYKGAYYRTDYGPITILTLDSNNGIPEETVNNPVGEKYEGNDSLINEKVWATEGLKGDPRMTTDTQGTFTASDYNKAFAKWSGKPESQSDLPNINPGTAQWQWVVEQLKDARAKGQIIIAQFHHVPYSSGVHGTPPNFKRADNQSGVAMRVYSPLFEEYQVLVIAGHDEMFERSFVDLDKDGKGFYVYDVGVAADGLRTEATVKDEKTGKYVDLNYNTHSVWTATDNEPEMWQTNANGVKHLIDGGVHYGHLQMDFENLGYATKLILTPVYIFPILDDNYDLVKTERRIYHDVVELYFDKQGNQITIEEVNVLQKNATTYLPEQITAISQYSPLHTGTQTKQDTLNPIKVIDTATVHEKAVVAVTQVTDTKLLPKTGTQKGETLSFIGTLLISVLFYLIGIRNNNSKSL